MEAFLEHAYNNLVLIFLIVSLVVAIVQTFNIIPRYKLACTLLTFITVILTIFIEECEHWSMVHGYVKLRLVLSVFKYLLYPLIMLFVIMMIEKQKLNIWILWGSYIVNVLVYTSAFYSDIAFTISSDNHWSGGPLRYFVYVISFCYIAYFVIAFYFKHKKDRSILITYSLIVLFVAVAMLFGMISSDNDYIILDSTILGGLLYYYLSYAFIKSNESLQIKEIELKNKQNELMISQMKPHFIYNTLNTIYSLVDIDKEKAKETIAKFAKYLRVNLDLKNELININDEINHCMNYTDIEMARYKNIVVNYDIQDIAFKIPPLSVQPMIENAIKHGIRIRDEGIVNVSTYKEDDYHIVKIEDNGIGFKEEDIDKNKEHVHIGLNNVRTRITELCKGELIVSSVIDVGTTIIIKIPVKVDEED